MTKASHMLRKDPQVLNFHFRLLAGLRVMLAKCRHVQHKASLQREGHLDVLFFFLSFVAVWGMLVFLSYFLLLFY